MTPCAEADKKGTHLVDFVEESLVSTRCLADDLEPVGRELVVIGSGLAFRKLVNLSRDLNGRFESEGESVVSLGL